MVISGLCEGYLAIVNERLMAEDAIQISDVMQSEMKHQMLSTVAYPLVMTSSDCASLTMVT